ncbi:MAG: protein kinase [Campylobacteraceae bacterium]|jgi:serine/threonine protein kinase|nr:protein kinase [Campylobacteraceae bacterium]
MIYPKSEEYRAAFHHVKDTLTDEILKNGIVKRNILGPQVLSGNFAYAYEVTSQYRIKYAVRCFRYDSKDRKERYKAISNYLKKLKSPYFVNFEYQDEGIIINNTKFPIVKMAWAEGELLGDFIKNNYANRFKIKNLLHSIRKLAKFIEKSNFAHGDIQPSNIMVSDNGRVLKLIDYDGMYVEELKSFGNAECGVPNFQHPKRNGFWSKKLDRFSFIALYTALLALMDRHYLWDETDSDVETILFRAEDYTNTKNSKIFKKLYALKSMKKYAESFENVCNGRFRNIPSLDSFIKENATKRHTSIIVPIASIAIVFFISIYAYYNQVSRVGRSSSLWQVITTIFWHQNTESVSIDLSQPQDAYLYDIGEYEIAIKHLKAAYDLYSNDTNITLSLIMLYGMSGFDDDALLKLALPLKEMNIEDERLFFSLAALYWRRDDLGQAKIFIDELKENLSKDIGLQKLIGLLDDIVQKESESYDLYYNVLNLEASAKTKFATSMVLWDRIKLYKNMEEMYKQSFIGFSAEHRFNIALSFRDWFEIYSGYNTAKSLQNLNDLHEKYPINNYLIYQLAINIAYLHVDGYNGNCAPSSNIYAYAAAILKDEANIVSANQALSYASRLLETSFSKAYGYYALGFAYYANNEFENAQKALVNSKNYAQKNLGSNIDSLLSKVTNSLTCEIVITDFQKF